MLNYLYLSTKNVMQFNSRIVKCLHFVHVNFICKAIVRHRKKSISRRKTLTMGAVVKVGDRVVAELGLGGQTVIGTS